jgi:3-hydroxybutyryl-CoA dehydratase
VKKGDLFSFIYVVSPKIHAGFIDIFQDKNPLHSNSVFAREKGFKGEVMHGNILGGFLSFFIGECLPVKNVIIHSQEIKYAHPVYLNDQLSLNVEIVDVFESVNVIEFKYYFQNEAGLKVAKGKINIGIIQ